MGPPLTPSTVSGSTTTSSTTTPSTTSTTSSAPSQLLEITVISAQDLAPIAKSMRTYAVVWVHPDRKLTTRVDTQGHSSPTWNDKFVFRVDDKFLGSDASAVMVEIYTVSWFRDNLVGTVRVLINNLIPPFARTQSNFSTRFVALQVRRASGSPQGILNMGVSLVDSTSHNMPIYPEGDGCGDEMDKKMQKEDLQKQQEEEKQRINAKIQLWRSRSEKTDLTFEEDFLPKGGSICNGSIINGSVCNGGSVANGSELYSDVGPSASIVAAAIAKGLYLAPAIEEKKVITTAEVEDAESSILEDLTVEEATAKGYKSKAERCRTDFQATKGHNSNNADSRHSRRHSDGGLFSCFAYGIEFTIVCGASTKHTNNSKNKKPGDKLPIKRCPSHQNLSL